MTVSSYDSELGSRYFKTVSAVLEYTHPLETCPDQDAVDRVKPNIVHRLVTGNRIFVYYNTYLNLMDALIWNTAW